MCSRHVITCSVGDSLIYGNTTARHALLAAHLPPARGSTLHSNARTFPNQPMTLSRVVCFLVTISLRVRGDINHTSKFNGKKYYNQWLTGYSAH